MAVKSRQLVIDMGGTNIRLGLVEPGVLTPTQIAQYKIDDYPGLAEVMQLYLQEQAVEVAEVQEMIVAVATPVEGEVIKLTNHDWNFRISTIREQFALQRVKVINDFAALALSLPLLQADERVQFGGAAPVAQAPIALLGPGTGLGMSGLLHIPGAYYPLSGEGGHVTVGARNARELAIFSLLAAKFGHVSAERLLSGTGLPGVYRALREVDGLEAEALSATEISRRAMAGECASCHEVMQLFCDWLGIIAGNLALTLRSTGGVYIGGGIVPKLDDYFLTSGFRQHFEDKGRFRQFMAQVPVFIIHAYQPALRGAAVALGERYHELGVQRTA